MKLVVKLPLGELVYKLLQEFKENDDVAVSILLHPKLEAATVRVSSLRSDLFEEKCFPSDMLARAIVDPVSIFILHATMRIRTQPSHIRSSS